MIDSLYGQIVNAQVSSSVIIRIRIRYMRMRIVSHNVTPFIYFFFFLWLYILYEIWPPQPFPSVLSNNLTSSDPIVRRSSSTHSIHLFIGLPLGLDSKDFHSVIALVFLSSPFYKYLLGLSLIHIFPGFFVIFFFHRYRECFLLWSMA